MEISNNGSLNEQLKFFCQPSYCSICESIQWLFGCLSSNLRRIITHKMINYQVAYNTTVCFLTKRLHTCKLQTQTGYKLQEEEVPILDICLGRVTPWSPATGHQPPATRGFPGLDSSHQASVARSMSAPYTENMGLPALHHISTLSLGFIYTFT